MIKTTEVQVWETQTVDIICNKCGESCSTAKRTDGSPEPHSFEGLLEVEVYAGYWSRVLGDHFRTKFSLCEGCLDKLFETFKIPVIDLNAYTMVEDTSDDQ